LLVAIADVDDGFSANPFQFALANSVIFVLFYPFEIGGNHLELQARTSGIQDENIHASLSSANAPRTQDKLCDAS
jgi:hypothetical protein